jgi:hypothetical protein
MDVLVAGNTRALKHAERVQTRKENAYA